MKFFFCLIKVLLGVCVFASISSAGGLDVSKPLKSLKVNVNNTVQPVNLFAIPVLVKPGGTESDQGRLLIVTAPQKKLYWWRYEMGGYPEHSSFPADQFMRSCKPYVDDHELIIFCTIGNMLLVSHSNRLYKNVSELESLVKTDFAQHGANFTSGLDYFDKKINLTELIEPGFFSEFGNAMATQIQLGDIFKANDHWEISLVGAKQNPEDNMPMQIKLKFTPEFSFISKELLTKP